MSFIIAPLLPPANLVSGAAAQEGKQERPLE
jgi:hypothetical protein